MNKFQKKPTSEIDNAKPGRFERFYLIENPFPTNPAVNKESKDRRINGEIYESAIRKNEYDFFINNFVKVPQADLNHLRLGYIIDTSYVGRGNGKTAYLVNLMQNINKEYCLDISSGINKCFSIYISPEPGGRTKTFDSFIDLIFKSMCGSRIIEDTLISLYLDSINRLYPSFNTVELTSDDLRLRVCLFDPDWYKKNGLSVNSVISDIKNNKHFQSLPITFPLFSTPIIFDTHIVSQNDIAHYYESLKRTEDKLNFIFTDIINFFQSAGFNGAYIFVDDFERIPDFLSARQKRDFALELRSCLFDGLYLNARIGFYNFILVLHAGVPRLIEESWAESGMENRSPISPSTPSKHIIKFEKLSDPHINLLLKIYLKEFRKKGVRVDELLPFTHEIPSLIGQFSEYNAAKVLRYAFELLESAIASPNILKIDKEYFEKHRITLQNLGPHSTSFEGEEPIQLS